VVLRQVPGLVVFVVVVFVEAVLVVLLMEPGVVGWKDERRNGRWKKTGRKRRE